MIDLLSAFKKGWEIFIRQGLPVLLKPFLPLIAAAIGTYIAWKIIKFIFDGVYGISLQMGGYSKREIKKKKRFLSNCIDVFSNLKDLSAIFKNK